MTGETDLHETIRTMVNRTEVLECVADGPADKRDLRDELGVSRSTVYKAVRELEERQLVEQTGDEVRLSLHGRLLFDEYRSFVATGADVCDHRDVLSALPPDAPVRTDLFVGSEVVRAKPVTPDRPLDYLEDLLMDADRVLGFAPAVFRRHVELFHEELISGGLSASVVFEESVVEHARDDYGERFRQSVEADCYALWETDEPLPFGLTITDGNREEVAVTVYDEGRPVAVVANDTDKALDWGRGVFERYRESARRVEAVETNGN